MYELAKFNDSGGNEDNKDESVIKIIKSKDEIILAGRTESFNKIRIDGFSKESLNEKIKEAPLVYPEMGAIEGVLLPYLQSNMVGAILFLRLPYITGQAGVGLTSVIFFLCFVSIFLTLLSLSALASNGKINKYGGLYQLVSRNLGVEIGGATGLLFYLGKALATSMYCLGASEALLAGLNIEGSFPWNNQVIAICLCIFLCIVVHFINAKFIDTGILMFLGIAFITIAAFTVGGLAFAAGSNYGSLTSSDHIINDNVHATFEYDHELRYRPSFFSMLALYYPSMTGIMTGSNRPGNIGVINGDVVSSF